MLEKYVTRVGAPKGAWAWLNVCCCPRSGIEIWPNMWAIITDIKCICHGRTMEMIECNIFQERLHDLSGKEKGGRVEGGECAASCSYFV